MRLTITLENGLKRSGVWIVHAAPGFSLPRLDVLNIAVMTKTFVQGSRCLSERSNTLHALFCWCSGLELNNKKNLRKCQCKDWQSGGDEFDPRQLHQ